MLPGAQNNHKKKKEAFYIPRHERLQLVPYRRGTRPPIATKIYRYLIGCRSFDPQQLAPRVICPVTIWSIVKCYGFNREKNTPTRHHPCTSRSAKAAKVGRPQRGNERRRAPSASPSSPSEAVAIERSLFLFLLAPGPAFSRRRCAKARLT